MLYILVNKKAQFFFFTYYFFNINFYNFFFISFSILFKYYLFIVFLNHRERREKLLKKKEGIITFFPINYQSLSTCPYELTHRPKDSIQLPTLHTLPPTFSLIRKKT
jgi:hypothetical protein